MKNANTIQHMQRFNIVISRLINGIVNIKIYPPEYRVQPTEAETLYSKCERNGT